MSFLPNCENAIRLDDKLLVMDNLLQDVAGSVAYDVDRTKGFPLKMDSTCLLMVSSGRLKVSVNFRDFVVAENRCVVIPSGTIIEQMEWDADTTLIFLSFSRNDHLSSPVLCATQVTLLRLQPVQAKMFEDLYRMLRTILTDTAFEPNRNECALHCVNLIGSIVARGANDNSEGGTKISRKEEIVARFLQCVNENYREHRELGFYAEQLGLSLKYMSQVIYGQTGRHPSQWIKDHVILDAKTMLRSGRYSIQQVAEELNFPNQSFFGKYFKEAVGVSPKKWC